MGNVNIEAQWLRRLPAGLKLLLLALINVFVFLIDRPVFLIAVFACVVILTILARAHGLYSALRAPGQMLLLAFAAHGLLGDWVLGVTVCLRIATLVLLATVISASIPLASMLAVLDRILAPLRWIGLPTRPVGVVIAMTLRFAPMLTERWQFLAESWRARSPRRPLWRLVSPFVISVIDDADRTAEALVARGGFDRRK